MVRLVWNFPLIALVSRAHQAQAARLRPVYWWRKPPDPTGYRTPLTAAPAGGRGSTSTATKNIFPPTACVEPTGRTSIVPALHGDLPVVDQDGVGLANNGAPRLMKSLPRQVCSSMCPHCGAINVFSRYSVIEALIFQECGDGFMASGLCNDPGAKDIAAPQEKRAGSNGITDPATGEFGVNPD